MELFATDTTSLQIKKFISKDSITLIQEAQLIWVDLDKRVTQQ